MKENVRPRQSQPELDDGSGSKKRQKSCLCSRLLSAGGCEWSTPDDGVLTFVAHDSRKLQHVLDAKLAFDREACAEFVAEVTELLSDTNVLHQACQPLQPATQATQAASVARGDSLVWVLLSVRALQQDLATFLLSTLMDLCVGEPRGRATATATAPAAADGDVDEDDDGGDAAPDLPELIVRQFRCLDEQCCDESVLDSMLQAFGGLAGASKAEMAAVIAQVTPESSVPKVLKELEDAVEADLSLVIAAKDAQSRLPLTLVQRVAAVDGMLQRLGGIAAADVAEIAHYALKEAVPGDHTLKVVKGMRAKLYFLDPSDPRLLTTPAEASRHQPDARTQSAAPGAARGPLTPEVALMRKLRCSGRSLEHVTAAFVTIWSKVTVLQELRVLDIWWLAVACRLDTGGPANAAVKAFKAAVVEVGPPTELLDRALLGHQHVVEGLERSWLAMASMLLGAAAPELVATGVHLCACLLQAVAAPDFRRSVLRMLQGCIGPDAPRTTPAALQALQLTQQRCPEALRQHCDLLLALTEAVESMPAPQLRTLFGLVATMALDEDCAQDEVLGVFDDDEAACPLTHRLQTLASADIAHPQAAQKRVGVMAVVEHCLCLARASPVLAEAAARQLEAALKLCARHPPTLAFLCDQLAERLLEDLRAERSLDAANPLLQFAREHFGVNVFERVFVGAVVNGNVTEHMTVPVTGGHTLTAALWLPLQSAAAAAAAAAGEPRPCFNLLHLLAATAPPAAHMLQCLAPVYNVLCATQLACDRGLVARNLFPGLPLAMYDFALLEAAEYAKLSAPLRTAVVHGLVFVVNFFREVVSVYGLAVTCNGGVPPLGLDTQEWALRRAIHLARLEAVLQHLLSLEKHGALPLPPLALQAPAAKAAAKRKAPAKSGKAKPKKREQEAEEDDEDEGEAEGEDDADAAEEEAAPEEGSVSRKTTARAWQQLRAAVRPLRPDAVNLLRFLPDATDAATQDYGETFIAAQYLLEDLHGKVVAAAAAARRPAFVRPSAALAAVDDSTVDRSFAAVLTAVDGCLGRLRTVLDVASASHGELLDGGALSEPESVWELFRPEAVDPLEDLTQTDGAGAPGDATDWSRILASDSAAADVAVACERTHLQALHILHDLLACPLLAAPPHLPFLTRLLAAFSDAPPPNLPPLNLSRSSWSDDLEAPDLFALLKLIYPCHKYFRLKLDAAAGALDHQVLLVRILSALCKLPDAVLSAAGVAQVGTLAHLPPAQLTILTQMSSQTAERAAALLAEAGDGEGGGARAAEWAARGPALAQVLAAHLAHSGDRAAATLKFASDRLPRLEEGAGPLAGKGGKKGGARKKGAEPAGDDSAGHVAGLPSLSSATLMVWYRVLFESAQAALATAVRHAQLHAKTKASALEALVPARLPEEDVIREATRQAVAAACALVKLTAKHDGRQPMLAAALRHGRKFVDTFIKMKGWLKAQLKRGSAEAQLAVKELITGVQEVTRPLQRVCEHAKALRMATVTRLVPKTRKTLDQFVQAVKVLMHECNLAAAFKQRRLKLKDLHGNRLPDVVEDDEDGEGEGEAAEGTAGDDEDAV